MFLRVNRSFYYKHFSEKVVSRVKENQDIKVKILELYAASDKRLSGNKIKERLQAVYGINIAQAECYPADEFYVFT